MAAKEVLNYCERQQRALHAIMERQERYRTVAEGITTRLTGMPGSQNRNSRVEEAAIALVDLSDKLCECALRYKDAVEQVERVLCRMPTARYQEVLSRKYILLQSWEQIAEAMGFSDVSTVYKAHGRALQEFDRLNSGE